MLTQCQGGKTQARILEKQLILQINMKKGCKSMSKQFGVYWSTVTKIIQGFFRHLQSSQESTSQHFYLKFWTCNTQEEYRKPNNCISLSMLNVHDGTITRLNKSRVCLGGRKPLLSKKDHGNMIEVHKTESEKNHKTSGSVSYGEIRHKLLCLVIMHSTILRGNPTPHFRRILKSHWQVQWWRSCLAVTRPGCTRSIMKSSVELNPLEATTASEKEKNDSCGMAQQKQKRWKKNLNELK